METTATEGTDPHDPMETETTAPARLETETPVFKAGVRRTIDPILTALALVAMIVAHALV